jgi:glucose-1-phosphate thymidylyltransferase
VGIQEKPREPKSSFAVTGLYIYSNNVFKVIKTLKPSARGELEITDVNNYFVNSGNMEYRILDGFWSDAGTFESLLRAGILIQKHSKNKNTE